MTYYCLDLFAGLQGFSQAFEAHPEWEVISVDITDTFTVENDDGDLVETTVEHDYVCDLLELTAADFKHNFDVVLASPPCTTFSLAAVSHHRHDDDTAHPKTQKAADHERLLYHLYNLIEALAPTYWFVENPMAKMRAMPPFGDPTGTITFCQFGENRRKPTDLWGEHPPNFEYRSCPNGADCHESAPRGSKTGTQGMQSSADRAKLPAEFSTHVCESVTTALNGDIETGVVDVEPDRDVEAPEYQSFCEYCGARRDPATTTCSECGKQLYSNARSGIRRCENGHYLFTANMDTPDGAISVADCKWCGLPERVQRGEEEWDYTRWHDSFPSEVADAPKRVETLGRFTYAVPANFEKVPDFTEEVVVYEEDHVTHQEVLHHAYYCPELDEVFCAHRSVVDELFEPENPRLPRQPVPEDEWVEHQYGGGLAAFTDDDANDDDTASRGRAAKTTTGTDGRSGGQSTLGSF